MKRIAISGLLVFLLVLVVTFPARVAYRWFAPPDIRLSGISGSVWNGSATEGLAGGAYLQDISWRLKPSELLTGALAFETSANPASGTMHADVAMGLGGNLVLTNLSGNVPLDLVHDAFQKAGISGDVSLQFSHLNLENGLPVDAEGSVTVANFYARDLSASVLGDYRAEFQSSGDGVTGRVEDVSGVLDIAGVVTINTDRSYSLVGEVAALPGAPPSIEQQLRFLGSADERGMRPFRFEGRL
ncbi:MAG: type II secretion system protein N [Gammaproteobacteria bacterium]|nr:type II secretion system protein N [Gammaproteobacteria bacterium]